MASKKVRGITIEIRGDSTNFGKAMDESKAKVTACNKEVSALKKSLKIEWNNSKFVKAQSAAKEKVTETKNQVSMLQQAIKKMEQEKGDTARNEVTKLKAELTAAEEAAEKAEKQLTQLNNMNLDRIASKANRFGSSMEKVGQKATAVTAAVVTGFTEAGKAAMEFNKSMAKVSTIADNQAESLESMRAEVLDISEDIGVAASDIAEATYQSISSGVKTENATSTVEKAGKAAVAGFTDIETAIDSGTTIVNAYGREIEDLDTIFDEFLVAQNYGKTTFGQMAEKIGNVVPVAAQLDVQTKELFASIATLTKQGQSTDTAITNLRGTLSSILKPTATAQAEAKKLGIEFNSTALKAKGLQGFLAEIQEKTAGNSDSLSKLFSNVRALNGALVLTGTGAQDFAGALEAMENSSGAVNSAFEKMAETEDFQITKNINELKNAAIELGNYVLPIATKFTNKLSEGAQWFDNLNSDTQGFYVKVLATAAAIGPFLLIIGKLATATGGIVTATKAATVAQTALNVAQAASPITLLLAGLGALIGVLVSVYDATNDLTDAQAEQSKKTDELIEKQKQLMEEFNNANKSIEEQQAKDAATVDEAKRLTKELFDLREESEKNNKKRKEMISLVDQLNNLLPDLNLQYDEERNELSLTRKEINKNIEAYEQLAKTKAAQSLIETAQGAKIDAKVSNTNIRNRRDEIKNQRDEISKKLDAYDEAQNRIANQVNEGLISYEAAQIKYNELDEEFLNKNGITVTQAAKQERSLLYDFNKLQSSITENNKIIAQANINTRKYSEYIKTSDTGLDGSNTNSGDKSSTKTSKTSTTKTKATVTKSSKTKTDIYKEKKDDLEYMLSIDVITEKQYYTKLAALQKKYLKKNSDEWRSAQKEIYNYQKSVKQSQYDEALDDLQEQYEKEQKIIEEAAEKQIETIEKVAEAKIAAIDEEIAAIDKAIEAREREKEAEEYQDQIAALDAQLKYGQLDDFTRAELESERQQLVDEREETLWRQGQEDRKEALEAQKTEIEEQAKALKEAVQTASEAQLAALEKTYNSSTKKLDKLASTAITDINKTTKAVQKSLNSTLSTAIKTLTKVTNASYNTTNNKTANMTINSSMTIAQITKLVNQLLDDRLTL